MLMTTLTTSVSLYLYIPKKRLEPTVLTIVLDLNLLGHPRQSDHLDYVPHSNLHPLSNHGSRGPRLSLPMSNPLSRPARIIGDASHHFRPYARRDPGYQSPFLGNPIHMDTFHPSPASQPIFERDSSHRVRELQPGTQLITPPFYQRELPVSSKTMTT